MVEWEKEPFYSLFEFYFDLNSSTLTPWKHSNNAQSFNLSLLFQELIYGFSAFGKLKAAEIIQF